MEHCNEVIISGRLSWGIKVDEIQKKAGGIFKKYSLGIATNERWQVPGGDEEKPMYVTCELYENVAQEAMTHLYKGSTVTIKGRLSYQTWDDRKTGEKREKHVIKVEKLMYEQLENPPVDF